MGSIADIFAGILQTFGLSEDLSVMVIVVPLLILAIYVNYKK